MCMFTCAHTCLCPCVYVCVCVYACVHVYTCVCVHMCVPACMMRVCMWTRVHVYMCTRVPVCVCACVPVCVCLRACVCTCACGCMHAYTYVSLCVCNYTWVNGFVMVIAFFILDCRCYCNGNASRGTIFETVTITRTSFSSLGAPLRSYGTLPLLTRYTSRATGICYHKYTIQVVQCYDCVSQTTFTTDSKYTVVNKTCTRSILFYL